MSSAVLQLLTAPLYYNSEMTACSIQGLCLAQTLNACSQTLLAAENAENDGHNPVGLSILQPQRNNKLEDWTTRCNLPT